MHWSRILSIKLSSGMVYALLGHTLGLWCRSLGYPIQYITMIGVMFLIPYNFKFLLCSYLLRFFSVNQNLILGLFISQYVLLLSLTFIIPGTIWFFIIAVMIAACNAVFDSIVVGQIRGQASQDDLKSIGTYFYVGEIIGMVIGNNVALFMSDYMEWYSVYRAIGCSAMILDCAVFGLKIIPQEHGSMKLAVSEFFERLKDAGWYFLLMIVIFRLQSAFLSQIPTLFLLNQIEMSRSDISFTKLFGYIGMALGVWYAQRLKNGMDMSIPILSFKLLPIVIFLYMAIYNIAPMWLIIVVGIFERFGRSLERIFLVTIQLTYSAQHHATLQWTMLDALGQITRSSGEACSGMLVHWLGWEWYFGMCALLNIGLIILMYRIKDKI